jgi:hypothetical protein
VTELVIASTWDGRPVGPDERVRLFIAVVDGAWCIRFDAPFHGDPAPDGPAGSRDGLWEHEVVELFVVGEDGQYTEVEWGPHGHHLLLRLGAPRRVHDRGHALDYVCSVGAGRWRGESRIPAALMPERPVAWNAFAIHGMPPARRYLAMSPLPGATPDFHQPGRFPRLQA